MALLSNTRAGLGVYFGVRELLRTEARTKAFGIKNLKMDEQRIVVQGFGNGVKSADFVAYCLLNPDCSRLLCRALLLQAGSQGDWSH